MCITCIKDIPYPSWTYPTPHSPPSEIPCPLLQTSGGHLWRPIQTCSLKALLPQLVLTSGGGRRSGIPAVLYASYWNAFLLQTAMTLSHICYHLAQHPEKQDKIYEELQRELPGNAPITYSAMHTQLKYLRACVKEVYRYTSVTLHKICYILMHCSRLLNDSIHKT